MASEAKRPSTVSKKRHRFQRVGERVANLQTELQLHVKTNANEISLTFVEELGLQGELTTIESFQLLYRKLQPLCTTTPQLLHHLQKIVKLLTHELAAEPVVDIQRERMLPVLKLLTALARELRREFYPHFAGVLPHIVAVIDTKDPELSTQVFKTLTMLFNILRVQLLKDMDAVHQCYFPLLGHPKPFVREFAAQTLSVLLRRIDDAKDLRKYLTTYLSALARGAGRDHEILRDGSAKLFFALLKNVHHSFHSRMHEIFVALLGSFRPKSGQETDAQQQQHELNGDIVRRTSDCMVKYTDADHALELLDCFSLVLSTMATKGERHAANDEYMARVLGLVLALVRYKSGKLITGNATNVTRLHDLLASLLKPAWMLTHTAPALRDALLRLCEATWRLVPANRSVLASQVAQFFQASSASDADVAAYWQTALLALVERVLRHTHTSVAFVRDCVFPPAMRLAMESLLDRRPDACAVLLGRLGDYALAHDELAEDDACVVVRDDQRLLAHGSGQRLLSVASTAVNTAITDLDDQAKLALAWKLVRAAALVDVDNAQRKAFASPLLHKLEARHRDNQTDTLNVLRAELWRVLQVADAARLKPSGHDGAAWLWQELRGQEQSFAMVSAVTAFLKMQTQEKQRALLPTSALTDAERLLGRNLRSPSRALRLVTLELLALFDRFHYAPSTDTDAVTFLEGECELLDHALGAERLCAHVAVDVEREIVRHVTRMKILAKTQQTPQVYKQLAVHHLFGLYHVKFATLWPHVREAVAEILSPAFALFWPSVSEEIWVAATRAELPPASSAVDSPSLEHVEKDAILAMASDFAAVCRIERHELDATAVTDTLTHHSLLWQTLAQCIDAAETKTKFLVPVFLLFLRDQYALLHVDELDQGKRDRIDEALTKAAAFEVGGRLTSGYIAPQSVTGKAVRQRTLDYLKWFAACKNLKGAFAQTLVHDVLFDLFLVKADDAVSKLALQCLFGFGSKPLIAYRVSLLRIADAATFRDELTAFDVAPEAGVVQQDHRAVLLPVLLRLLYAKAVSKKGRNAGDTVGARRAAVLSYLAALPPQELAGFIELVVRAFDIPVDMERVQAVTPVAKIESVSATRVLGFLNLLEDLIAQLGVHLAPFVPTLSSVVVAVLAHNFQQRDDELATAGASPTAAVGDDGDDVAMATDDDEDHHDHEMMEDAMATATTSGKGLAMRKQIRTLAFRRLGELVDKYDSRVHLLPWVTTALRVANEAVLHLPGAVVGAAKSSALLRFVVSVACGERARHALLEAHVLAVVRALTSGLDSATGGGSISPEVLGSVLQFLSGLLDGDELEDSDTKQLIPHIPFVLSQFVARFEARASRFDKERYAGSAKRELALLCRVSAHVASAAVAEPHAMAPSAVALFQLLLPFLQRNHRSSAADMDNILQVLARLVPLVETPKKHVPALAKLLAPGPSVVLDRGVRARLVELLVAIVDDKVGAFLQRANAFDAKRIEDEDIETRLEALRSVELSAFAGVTHEPAALAPVAAQLLSSLHEREYSLRSSALVALSTLVRLCAETKDVVLLNVLESVVMPSVRHSVKAPSEDVRRGFVLLLAAMADHAAALEGLAFVPVDLAVLRRADDVEVDFFFNLTHIQVHRKRRALQKLSALMNDMATVRATAEDTPAAPAPAVVVAGGEEEDEAMASDEEEEEDVVMAMVMAPAATCFSNSTVNSLLLPLVMHFIYEAQAKSQESLRHEAAQCVGAAAGLLGWSHYLALLRRLLKSIDGHAESETAIIAAICVVVDHHHFATPASAAFHSWRHVAASATNRALVAHEDDKVADQLETQVLPMLKRYLFKAVTAKGAAKLNATTSFESSVVASQDVVVRVPLALAVVKVLRRLRAASFFLEFPKLLVSLVKLLKHKLEDVRASARATLVKIVEELGTAYLLPVVDELRHSLQEASTHVLAYTLHVILETVSKIVLAKKPASLLLPPPMESNHDESADAFASDLDACLPSVLEILVDDLFQGVGEGGEGQAHQPKSKTKEAKSTSKSYDALEVLARSLAFLPNPSVHRVVGALVAKFLDHPSSNKSAQVLQEALRRVALGLTKNASVDASHLLLYTFNVLDASLESIRPMTDAEKAKLRAAQSRAAPWLGGAVAAWQVNEKSDGAARQLARRVRARDAAKVTLQPKMTGFDRHAIEQRGAQTESVTPATRVHLDELLAFATYLLFAFVRSPSSSTAETPASAMATLVDPLVPPLMRCASESKNNRAVIHALKCLGVLLHENDGMELPSLDVSLAPLVDRLFKILQKAGAATRGNELVQTCYRTLTVVLRHRPQHRLTEAQLRVLVSFVRADLDETEHQNATYALLKSIVASRLVIPEIYDVVLRVGEVLVQTHAATARAHCGAILTTFLLEYPLGGKRLTQQLTFLLNNLQYEYESGRRAVLETLTNLLKKLPLDVLNDKAQFFLLPLVLRLANDDAVACRAQAAVAIMALVKRLSNQTLNETLTLVAKWWANRSDRTLLATAAQVTTLVLECRPEFLDRHASAVLATISEELQAQVDALAAGYEDDDEQDEAEQDQSKVSAHTTWPLVEHLLLALAKFSERLVATAESWLLGDASVTLLKQTLPALLEYPHVRVRHAAVGVLKSYVARRELATLGVENKAIKKLTPTLSQQSRVFLSTRGALFAWASRASRVLEKPTMTPALAEVTLAVLSWLCSALQTHEGSIPQDVASAGDALAAHAEEQPAQDDATDAPEADAADGDVEVNSDADDNDADEGDVEAVATAVAAERAQETQQSKTPLGWMLTRLSYVARGVAASKNELVATTIFKFFAAFIHEQSAATVQRFVVQLLNPLYRAAAVLHDKKATDESLMRGNRRGPTRVEEPPASALLAQEILERLEAKIGGTAFVDAYTFVQRKLAVFRASRKEQRKRELLQDPARAAQRKIQKNETKRRAKQLKKRKFTVMKGTASAAARPTKLARPGAN